MPRTRTPSTREESIPEPRIDDIVPAAALPLGEVEFVGEHLGPMSLDHPLS
jgi:hypothetical protein